MELWIASAALVVAVMALPTVFQMYGGRPKAQIEFVDTPTDHAEVFLLEARITNPPPSRHLRRIGVYRRIAERVDVGFAIYDFDTANNLIGGIIRPEIQVATFTGTESVLSPIRLFPDEPAMFSIATKAMKDDAVQIIVPDMSRKVNLPVGTYRVEVFTQIRSEPAHISARYLSAGPGNLQWGEATKATMKVERSQRRVARVRRDATR